MNELKSKIIEALEKLKLEFYDTQKFRMQI